MVFSSNVFLFFYLPIVLGLYYVMPRVLRNPVLFVVSLFFYGWGEPIYVVLMVATILLNYIFGAIINHKKRRGKSAKAALIIGVILNVAILGYFKYAGFFMENAQAILPFLRVFKVPDIELPIGISFYVFQSMSYIIDVYRDDAPVQKNPITFGTYVTLFPQLIAGPIVRYADVATQLRSRKETSEMFASGVRLFVVGLAKKVLLANAMGLFWSGVVNPETNFVEVMGLEHYSGTLGAWVGIAAYTLQLYFDFSGYSDMAIGLGRMFGFEFLINFNYPYISRSITEFWRRWHISLSTWFREYVYIPLGGNRKGIARQIINLMVVWTLTGFWHGASWNFLLWGLYYGILLIVEKLFLKKLLDKLPGFLRHLYALPVVLLGWALFYFEDMSKLGGFCKRLFVPEATPGDALVRIASFLPIMVVAAVAATPLGKRLYDRYSDKLWCRVLTMVGMAVLLVICIAVLVSQSYNPFIYFRF